MLIAQISDTHVRADGTPLRGTIDTIAALDAALAALMALTPRPDVVLATGDLADDGRDADYHLLRERFGRLPMAVFVIPGNHDDRDAMRRVFAGSPMLPETDDGDGFLHYTVESEAVRLIGLDTVYPGEVWGGLCEERLTWLAGRLAAQPGARTLIFMHHPPFITGLHFLDLPFPGAGPLKAMIGASPQVELMVCGHFHRAIARRWAGTQAIVAPSTVYQMNLALAPGVGFRPTADPAGLALSLWPADDHPITYTVPVTAPGAVLP
jgi:3',5'-cyclic AMP phosphodiesterase CpdA